MVESMHQVADAQQRVSGLPLLSDAEREQVLVEFNATRAPYPQHALIHALFEAQVARTPDAPAVLSEAQQLSYEELNCCANRLARHLRALGVGPEQRVALCLERSPQMLVALLAVLKAGGAYVPLDAAQPLQRLSWMLSDCMPLVMLTQGEMTVPLRQVLAEQGLPTVVLDVVEAAGSWAQSGAMNQSDAMNLEQHEVGVRAEHLAYVIYTSGSTGRPKGVMIQHTNVVNLWCALEQRVYREAGSLRRVSLNAPLAFDASVQQWTRLLSGAAVVIVPQPVRLDPQALLDYAVRWQIDVLDCTPSQLKLLSAAQPAQGLGFLRATPCERKFPSVLLVGGEAIAPAQWRALAASGLRAFNVYGPTECTVDATAALISQSEVPHIGRPLANTQVYLLDAQQRPVPRGVVGELYIGGAGVARGYLNAVALTAERFCADPFVAMPGARMYRTGDLARHLPSGDLEFLGRNDRQVKLRGFRIELGEIEAVLAACPGVREAVVVARADPAGEMRLVAYVVSDGHAALSAATLRSQLARQLAEYMLPAAYVVLDRLPLSVNGKLDHNALPAPDGAAAAVRAYQPPQGSIEQKLAQLWCGALGVERVGRSDHFFELGGHSLLVLSLMARIEDEFGVAVPRSTLVANLDLASQANAIVASQANAIAAAASGVPSADNSMVGAPIALSTAPVGGLITGGLTIGVLIRALPAQKAIYKAIRYQPQNLGNTSWMVLAFDPSNPPDTKVLQSLLQSVLSRHESLRSRFVIEHGELYLEPAKRFVFRLEKRQSLGSVELDLRDFVRPFFLEDGMNVRGRWVSGDGQFLLLLGFSHACIDGAGMAQLLQTLVAGGDESSTMGSVAAYSALFYSDAFARLRAEHAGFWRDRLHDYTRRPTVSSLPALSGSWRIVLGADLKVRVGTLTARLQISAHEFFATAFLRLKARLDDDHEQLVSMMFHGRDRLEQRAVIAPLMVQLPLRLSLSGDAAADLIEVAAAVRQAQRYYLFDADSLSATYPDLSREVLSPAALFGYYLKDAFSGRIAGASCRVLEVPDIGSAASNWRLTCEVAEHPLGFDVNLEADRYEARYGASCATTDTAALFKEIVEGLLSQEQQA